MLPASSGLKMEAAETHKTTIKTHIVVKTSNPTNTNLCISQFMIRSTVQITADLKMAAFWDVAPCNLVDTNRRFRGAYCLHHHGRQGDGGSKLL
jgi:hypothetical protein